MRLVEAPAPGHPVTRGVPGAGTRVSHLARRLRARAPSPRRASGPRLGGAGLQAPCEDFQTVGAGVGEPGTGRHRQLLPLFGRRPAGSPPGGACTTGAPLVGGGRPAPVPAHRRGQPVASGPGHGHPLSSPGVCACRSWRRWTWPTWRCRRAVGASRSAPARATPTGRFPSTAPLGRLSTSGSRPLRTSWPPWPRRRGGGDVGVVAVRHRESILGRSYPAPTRAASCSPRDLGRFQRPAIRTPSARTSTTTPSHDETVAAWAALSLRTLNP